MIVNHRVAFAILVFLMATFIGFEDGINVIGRGGHLLNYIIKTIKFDIKKVIISPGCNKKFSDKIKKNLF